MDPIENRKYWDVLKTRTVHTDDPVRGARVDADPDSLRCSGPIGDEWLSDTFGKAWKGEGPPKARKRWSAPPAKEKTVATSQCDGGEPEAERGFTATDLLSVDEVASLLCYKSKTIRNLMSKREFKLGIHYVKPRGRVLFLRSKIEEWVREVRASKTEERVCTFREARHAR